MGLWLKLRDCRVSNAQNKCKQNHCENQNVDCRKQNALSLIGGTHIQSNWWTLHSHSQKCDPTRRKSCRTHSFVSKKLFAYFSEHLFYSIRQLTCLHHVQRIISTLQTICTVSELPLWCPRYHFSCVARYIRILLLALYNVQERPVL